MNAQERYERYKRAIAGLRLPLALVDVDALDRNAERLLVPVRERGLHLRIASKSLRSVDLIRRLVDRSGGTIRGVMAYAVAEAALLVEHGFRDVLVAYPTLQAADAELLAQLNGDGATVSVIVDCPEHLEALARAAETAAARIPVVIEVDMSYRLLDGRIHLGVRRSPLHTPDQVVDLAEQVRASRHLRFLGVMGYEAQIAGATDSNPFSPMMNAPKRLVKRLSRSRVVQSRMKIADSLAERGMPPLLFNGGGTGSLSWSSKDASLTEVSAGSGFLDSHLFDYYQGLDLEPACSFALQVVRRPAPGMVTCHGGGYVASGEPGEDRLPRPYLPTGLELTRLEAAGEVQTPLSLPSGVDVALGDPIFFRHAKAGELAEHFEEYHLVKGDRVVGSARTYRGMGKRFV